MESEEPIENVVDPSQFDEEHGEKAEVRPASESDHTSNFKAQGMNFWMFISVSVSNSPFFKSYFQIVGCKWETCYINMLIIIYIDVTWQNYFSIYLSIFQKYISEHYLSLVNFCTNKPILIKFFDIIL